MTIFIWLTAISWGILFIYWLISAFRAKKTEHLGPWWQNQVRVRLIFIVIATTLLYIIKLLFGFKFLSLFIQSTTTITNNILLGIIGIIICLMGLVLALWARTTLGRNWGMPMTLRKEHQLVMSGPYSLIRHPIYTAFLLMMLGSIFTSGIIWLIPLIGAGIYFVTSAKLEEKDMLEKFSKEYIAYKKRTKMFIPFLL